MRTEAHTLSDDDLQGLLQGNVGAVKRIQWFVGRVANYRSRFGVERAEVEDLIAESMLDAFQQAAHGRCSNAVELEEVIEKSVRRNVQQIKKRRRREERAMDTERIPFYRAAPPYRSRLTPEERIRMEDLLPKAANVREIYRDTSTQEQHGIVTVDLLSLDEELIRHLQKHPRSMYELTPVDLRSWWRQYFGTWVTRSN